MTIKRLTTTRDEAGFPVMEWTETRTSGPDVTVRCFICKSMDLIGRTSLIGGGLSD
jgi:hypothetical protein